MNKQLLAHALGAMVAAGYYKPKVEITIRSPLGTESAPIKRQTKAEKKAAKRARIAARNGGAK